MPTASGVSLIFTFTCVCGQRPGHLHGLGTGDVVSTCSATWVLGGNWSRGLRQGVCESVRKQPELE